MKKGFIFDLDGTLINSLPDIRNAMNRSLRTFGLPEHPLEKYNYMVGNGALNLTRRAIGEHADFYERVLHAYMADYAAHSRVDTAPYPGIPEALRVLQARGMRLCVFSNKDQSDVENIVAYYFPDIRFDAVRGRQENVPLKPDPAGALLSAEKMGLAPDECWYVGDTGTDMDCANNARMDAVGVLWGFRTRAELEEHKAGIILASPAELTAL